MDILVWIFVVGLILYTFIVYAICMEYDWEVRRLVFEFIVLFYVLLVIIACYIGGLINGYTY